MRVGSISDLVDESRFPLQESLEEWKGWNLWEWKREKRIAMAWTYGVKTCEFWARRCLCLEMPMLGDCLCLEMPMLGDCLS